MLPISVQSRMTAKRLGIPLSEVQAVAVEAARFHALDIHWVTVYEVGAIEVGMGKGASSLSTVYRQVAGRWEEQWKLRRAYNPGETFQPLPPSAYY